MSTRKWIPLDHEVLDAAKRLVGPYETYGRTLHCTTGRDGAYVCEIGARYRHLMGEPEGNGRLQMPSIKDIF